MMNKIIIAALLFTGIIFSQDAGKTGLSFLKFGFGARNIAMGDAGNSIASDVTSLFYNPSKLAMSQDHELMFMHNEWIQDVRSEVLGARTVLFGLPIALGVNVTSISDIEIRRIPGAPDATFSANYFYGSLSTGFKLTDELGTGISVKYLYEGLYQDEANGWGIDLGFYYILPVEGLTASASVRNIGTMDALRVEETKLPSEVRAGLSYSQMLSSNFDLSAGAELQKYFESTTHINFGAEILYSGVLALRGGYQTGFETRGLTAGVGIKWGSLRFDYAFLPFSLGIGNANLLSLSFKF
jgi:hypothetical protein